MSKLNKNFWKKKKVLITGHTGFKGSWLTILLKHLGAKVYGYSLGPLKGKSFYRIAGLKSLYDKDIKSDIRDFKKLNLVISKIKPDIIFHLAAQSSVIESFQNSDNTVSTNVVGTFNLLEILKNKSFVKSLIIVTTDKVYQNYSGKKYFDEKSQLGGDDIYSGSKACCELLANSYNKSFFNNLKCNIATVRAGNCFGGGDWTPNRIVKDCLENFFDNKKITLRNPDATRPWQHVIEPILGYLLLTEKLVSKMENIVAWNFGPSLRQNMKVIQLTNLFKKKINSKSKIIIKKKDKMFHNKKLNIFESRHLNINSKKSLKYIKWQPKMTILKAVELTVDWYLGYRRKKNLIDLTNSQIKNYLN